MLQRIIIPFHYIYSLPFMKLKRIYKNYFVNYCMKIFLYICRRVAFLLAFLPSNLSSKSAE